MEKELHKASAEPNYDYKKISKKRRKFCQKIGRFIIQMRA